MKHLRILDYVDAVAHARSIRKATEHVVGRALRRPAESIYNLRAFVSHEHILIETFALVRIGYRNPTRLIGTRNHGRWRLSPNPPKTVWHRHKLLQKLGILNISHVRSPRRARILIGNPTRGMTLLLTLP